MTIYTLTGFLLNEFAQEDECIGKAEWMVDAYPFTYDAFLEDSFRAENLNIPSIYA